MQRHSSIALRAAAALLAALVMPATAQDIYVTEDAEGNPVYSDRPSGNTSPIRLRESNTYEAQPIPETQPGIQRGDDDDEAVDYEVRITRPADEATIRAPEGRVEVDVSVEPSLQRGHSLQLLRNGSAVPGTGSSFSVQTYDRGANEFIARIMDGERELLRSAPVTVYLLR